MMNFKVPSTAEVLAGHEPKSYYEARFCASALHVRASTLADKIKGLTKVGLTPPTSLVNDQSETELAANMMDSWADALRRS